MLAGLPRTSGQQSDRGIEILGYLLINIAGHLPRGMRRGGRRGRWNCWNTESRDGAQLRGKSHSFFWAFGPILVHPRTYRFNAGEGFRSIASIQKLVEKYLLRTVPMAFFPRRRALKGSEESAGVKVHLPVNLKAHRARPEQKKRLRAQALNSRMPLLPHQKKERTRGKEGLSRSGFS